MKFITSIVASLAISALVSFLVTFAFTRTLMNATYLSSQADKAGLYNEVTVLLPKALAGENASQTQINQAAAMVDPTKVKSALDQFLHDMEKFLKDNGAPPEIAVAQFVSSDGGNGLSSEIINQKIKFPEESAAGVKSGIRAITQGEKIGLYGTILLLLVLILLCVKQHNYKPLIGVFMMSALFTAASYYIIRFGATLASEKLKQLPDGFQGVSLAGQTAIKNISADISQKFLTYTIVLLVLASLLIIVNIISYFRHRHGTTEQKSKTE